jgi:hypothetical protein
MEPPLSQSHSPEPIEKSPEPYSIVQEMLRCDRAKLIHPSDKIYIGDLLSTFDLHPPALLDDITKYADPFEGVPDRYDCNHQILLDLYERTADMTEALFKSVFSDSLLFQQLRADGRVTVPVTKKGLAAHARVYAEKLYNVKVSISLVR